MDYRNSGLESLANWFTRFGDKECREVSPLYHFFAHEIATDAELLRLAGHSRRGQPVPNLFLAAIHLLVLEQKNSRLAAYYPSVSPGVRTLPPFDEFKKFALDHSRRVIDILRSRTVQTNALNRTAYLMPVFSALSELYGPLNLVDIGASAGLMLNFAHYEYRYGSDLHFGDSPVKVYANPVGGQPPSFRCPRQPNRKTGIDQSPLDVGNPQDVAWLKALIWPDQQARFVRLEEAIRLTQQNPVNLERGRSVEDFRRILQAQEKDLPLVVYHTHVLYQFDEEQRRMFWRMLDELGRLRNLYYLAAEAARILPGGEVYKGVLVQLTSYLDGKKERRQVALTDGHAHWIRWLE